MSVSTATGNRFAVVTPDDHSASLIVVTILSVIFSCLIFAVRIFVVKWKRHSYEDGILALAHLTALGQWVSIFIALQYGLGKSLTIVSIRNQNIMAKAAFAGRILLIPTLCLSKISVLMVLRSLFHWETRRRLLSIDITIFIVAVWGCASTLALSIDCSPDYLLGPENGTCSNNIARIQAVMIVEIITEFTIFALSPVFLYTFEIALNTKMLVVSAFMFRLPLIALSILYLLSQSHLLDTSSTGISVVPTILYQQILLPYSLMSATIPCLRAFVETFKTTGVSYIVDPNAGRIITESESSYELGNVKRREKEKEKENKAVGDVNRLSARLSRAWMGTPDQALDTHGSTVPMVLMAQEV